MSSTKAHYAEKRKFADWTRKSSTAVMGDPILWWSLSATRKTAISGKHSVLYIVSPRTMWIISVLYTNSLGLLFIANMLQINVSALDLCGLWIGQLLFSSGTLEKASLLGPWRRNARILSLCCWRRGMTRLRRWAALLLVRTSHLWLKNSSRLAKKLDIVIQ